MSSPFLPATVTVRRYLAFFLALMLAATVLAIATAAPARAAYASEVIGGITYTVDTTRPGAGATVTRYYAEVTPREVVIPDTVSINDTDYPVTAIGGQAFVSQHGGKYFTSVTLPDSIVTIGDWAFTNNLLTSVTLPEGLATLGRNAFSDNLLASVDLPESLTALGDLAFISNQLKSVDIPSSLAAIGNHAFARNQLTSVVLPAGVTTVGEGAFSYNENLSQVQFTGPAPTTIRGADSEYPSLGTAPGLTVTFPAQYLAESPEQGYTTPQWLGYTARLTSYAVSFDTGGGAVVEPVTVSHGALVELPAAPVREGYSFTGWFTSAELDIRFDSSVPIDEDMTLFAGWQLNKYAVSFDTGGGAVVEPVTVSHGALVELPAAPVREGYSFTGWFTSAELDIRFDSALPITESLTLYAGWQQNSYTVSFDTGGGALIEPVIVSHGGLLELPSVPVREGYTFTHWSTSPELDVPFDSALPITESLTLYAGWQLNDVPVLPETPGWVSSVSGSLGSLALSSPVT